MYFRRKLLFKQAPWMLGGLLGGLLGCASQDSSTRDPASVAAPTVIVPWSYDAGPDPATPMGRKLIDINAGIPSFPEISEAIMGDQKFRPAYGPIPWRMLQRPNSVKILFIGQDGTHIAEAAGRPATAGFGGRAQDLAKHFGVDYSAAFINTYAFTIKGQYGAFDTPMIRQTANGDALMLGGVVDNPLWLMTHDIDSPIAQWRNQLIEWIIRNNRDSLKMIVLFGGAARDAAASFVISKGGQVGARNSAADMAKIQVPEVALVSAGGNNEVPVPVDADGKDLYPQILGRTPNYTMPEGEDLKAAQDALKTSLSTWKSKMVFSKGGPAHNGVIHPAQIGGFDMDQQMMINGQKTLSLKGLKLSNDFTIDHDILVVQLPHPSALSTMKPEEASQKVDAALQDIKPYVAKGWVIPADNAYRNTFAAGESYKYGRSDMGPEYYDFGAPASRMVDVSSASRLNRNVIVFGTRDKANFDQATLKAMTDAKPAHFPDAAEMWTARPRLATTRYIFDSGPGEKYARAMKDNIPTALIKSHAVNGDYGHYRGTFKNPKVLIIADPDGYDDLITARALTGTRGQYLHGLMSDLGVGDQYLVLKTAPFGFDSASDWQQIMNQTNGYREYVLKQIFADSKPMLILTDGPSAAAEAERIIAGKLSSAPIVNIARSGTANKSGIVEAGAEIKTKVPAFAAAQIKGQMEDIPRTHLSYYARLWEGTSGDRVITSSDAAYRGKAFAEVAPQWAVAQKVQMGPAELEGIKKLQQKLQQNRVRKGNEPIPTFLQRMMHGQPQAALDTRVWLGAA
ncbi:MAG: hypothetical protein JST16_19185 [Bdellovibrionales bacterium]|nr:hypothetical protein [Bdellovibrionales bacterium]